MIAANCNITLKIKQAYEMLLRHGNIYHYFFYKNFCESTTKFR